mmetsp:Transcript_2993/g.6439  ORF Transcript_2993/g.6439 Transcript_2993/m.6439 type:complete len:321 (-) Transcript_2993:731-1693(-)
MARIQELHAVLERVVAVAVRVAAVRERRIEPPIVPIDHKLVLIPSWRQLPLEHPLIADLAHRVLRVPLIKRPNQLHVLRVRLIPHKLVRRAAQRHLIVHRAAKPTHRHRHIKEPLAVHDKLVLIQPDRQRQRHLKPHFAFIVRNLLHLALRLPSVKRPGQLHLFRRRLIPHKRGLKQPHTQHVVHVAVRIMLLLRLLVHHPLLPIHHVLKVMNSHRQLQIRAPPRAIHAHHRVLLPFNPRTRHRHRLHVFFALPRQRPLPSAAAPAAAPAHHPAAALNAVCVRVVLRAAQRRFRRRRHHKRLAAAVVVAAELVCGRALVV